MHVVGKDVPSVGNEQRQEQRRLCLDAGAPAVVRELVVANLQRRRERRGGGGKQGGGEEETEEEEEEGAEASVKTETWAGWDAKLRTE